MREELSAENRALVERVFGGDRRALFPTDADLNALLDAARSEGATFTGGVSLSSVPRSEGPAKPPQGDVGADSGLEAADDNRPTTFTPEQKRRALALIDPCMELEELDAARRAHRAAVEGPSAGAIAAVEARLQELLDSVDALVKALPDPVVERHAAEIERVIEALGACSIQELDAIDLPIRAADDNHKALVEAVARHVFMGALTYAFGYDAKTTDRLTLEQREATVQRLSAEAMSQFAPTLKEMDHGEG